METSFPTPTTARVYVNLPEGNGWILATFSSAQLGSQALHPADRCLVALPAPRREAGGAAHGLDLAPADRSGGSEKHFSRSKKN